MTFPSPAERGWFFNNHESTPDGFDPTDAELAHHNAGTPWQEHEHRVRRLTDRIESGEA